MMHIHIRKGRRTSRSLRRSGKIINVDVIFQVSGFQAPSDDLNESPVCYA